MRCGLPQEEKITPAVRALDRSQIHPSAVFEIEDSGFVATYALNIALVLIVLLLLALVVVLVTVLVIVLRKRKRKSPATAGQTENGGNEHE